MFNGKGYSLSDIAAVSGNRNEDGKGGRKSLDKIETYLYYISHIKQASNKDFKGGNNYGLDAYFTASF